MKYLFERYDIVSYFESIKNISFFLSIQRGMALVLPLVMIGAFAITLRNFPFSIVQQSLDAFFGPSWTSTCDAIIASSFGILSLAVVCAISGAMTAIHNQRHPNHIVTPTMSVVVVLSCFIVLVNPGESGLWGIAFSMDRGLLVAMLAAVSGARIYLCLTRVRALQLPMVSTGNEAHIRDILTVMPAGMLTIFIFACAKMILVTADIQDLHGELASLIASPFMDMHDRIGLGMAYSALIQALWFFGAHGPNLLFSVEESVLAPAALANLSAHIQGTGPELILTKTFFDAFTRIGGSGSTLCLILAILWKSRDGGARKICLISLMPALCNVNEPLIYGIPLILNPTYFIPFFITPVVQTLSAHFFTAAGFVTPTLPITTWTTPPLLNGYLATANMSGVLMQLFNIGLGVMIYAPFVVISDTIQARNTKRVMKDLLNIVQSCSSGINGKKCLNHSGEIGRMAKGLAHDLQQALLDGNQLYLEFQPQIDASRNRVHGAEALLRWRHPSYGMIAPPITVSIAEDAGFMGHLGLFVIVEACSYRISWSGVLPADTTISVNVSPLQLANPNFEQQVKDALTHSGLDPHMLVLEIVESSVIEPDNDIVTMLQRFQQMGIRVAIDDFGMGHASLRYLREFPVDTVKIDRSLTEMSADGVNDHIVRSIVELSRSLNFSTVVEGVETEEQMRRFLALGCDTFQGYLFSRPLSGENCLEFMKKWICEEKNSASNAGAVD